MSTMEEIIRRKKRNTQRTSRRSPRDAAALHQKCAKETSLQFLCATLAENEREANREPMPKICACKGRIMVDGVAYDSWDPSCRIHVPPLSGYVRPRCFRAQGVPRRATVRRSED